MILLQKPHKGVYCQKINFLGKIGVSRHPHKRPPHNQCYEKLLRDSGG